jgi:hypothetical protein
MDRYDGNRQTDRTLEQQQAARNPTLWRCISVTIPSCRQGRAVAGTVCREGDGES